MLSRTEDDDLLVTSNLRSSLLSYRELVALIGIKQKETETKNPLLTAVKCQWK